MQAFTPIRFGKYLLMDKIAVGGMAEVYRAMAVGDQGFEKLVAVKKILPHLSEEKDLVESFIDEAKLAALLQHENIVQIYDFGKMERDYFIAMEYLFGKNLRNVADAAARQDLPMSLEHALYITARVCDGLDYSHGLTDLTGRPLSIIHRDVSPPNVFITYEGQVKLVDYGVAKAASQNTTTQAGVIKGKVAYMSPEQARGEAIDHRSDIFSLGVLFYELACQKKMFTGEAMAVLARVQNADFEPSNEAAPQLPGCVHETLARALEKDRDNRYQNCGDMLADVEECLFSLGSRPSARTLSVYMKDIFHSQLPDEERTKKAMLSSGHEAGKDRAEQEPEHTLFEDQLFVRDYRRARSKKLKIIGAIAGALLAVILLILKLALQEPAIPPEALDALNTGRYADSVASFEAALAKYPELEEKAAFPYSRALLSLALQVADKDPAAARGLLDRATALAPGNMVAWLRLGNVCLALKDYPAAEKAFSRVLELDPSRAQAAFNLGYVYAVAGQPEKAEEMYLKTVALNPPFLDEALANLAAVQDNLGKTDEAIQSLEKALAANPENGQAQQYLEALRAGGGSRK